MFQIREIAKNLMCYSLLWKELTNLTRMIKLLMLMRAVSLDFQATYELAFVDSTHRKTT